MLWRELRVRYGEYFEGGMGAETILKLIARIDLDAEEIKLRDTIDAEGRPRPLSAQRKQKAIKRLKIVYGLQPPRRARPAGQRPAGDDPRAPCRSSRRTCARWCSSTVAASPPRT